jgi:hypothetical protein
LLPSFLSQNGEKRKKPRRKTIVSLLIPRLDNQYLLLCVQRPPRLLVLLFPRFLGKVESDDAGRLGDEAELLSFFFLAAFSSTPTPVHNELIALPRSASHLHYGRPTATTARSPLRPLRFLLNFRTWTPPHFLERLE